MMISTPDNHFTAGPDCRVAGTDSGRVAQAGGCPTIREGIVSSAGVQSYRCCYFRPRRSFHCRSIPLCDPPASRRVDSAGGGPTICAGIVSSAGVQHRYRPSLPPQTIISLPVHTAVCSERPEGALVVLVAVQLSVLGLYLPPVFKSHQYRPRQSFQCQSTLPCERIVRRVH